MFFTFFLGEADAGRLVEKEKVNHKTLNYEPKIEILEIFLIRPSLSYLPGEK